MLSLSGFMTKFDEPHFKKSNCSYCGDAPVAHALFYFDSLVSAVVDPHVSSVARRAPKFIKNFADWLINFSFKFFTWVRLARFSEDISRANTFRSRVIWEEALRRGIRMEQLILFGKPIDYYRAWVRGAENNKPKEIFFQSMPIPSEFLEFKKDWDNKFVLKEELQKLGVPVPAYKILPMFYKNKIEKIFAEMEKPVIVKPKLGSRGRHTTTGIRTLEDFKEAIKIARQISPFLIAEEHLDGYVCRATVVNGKLAGFYRGQAPSVVGDGAKTVRALIEEKDHNRPDRVEAVVIGEELEKHIRRAGYNLDEILPAGKKITLTHRVGRLFGGATKEMLPELHPSFVPILEKAAQATELIVAGFDCIVPDPTASPDSQRWGIIECNTLPFIDLHYYALEGRPQNIAGMIWDFWN